MLKYSLIRSPNSIAVAVASSETFTSHASSPMQNREKSDSCRNPGNLSSWERNLDRVSSDHFKRCTYEIKGQPLEITGNSPSIRLISGIGTLVFGLKILPFHPSPQLSPLILTQTCSGRSKDPPSEQTLHWCSADF